MLLQWAISSMKQAVHWVALFETCNIAVACWLVPLRSASPNDALLKASLDKDKQIASACRRTPAFLVHCA